MARGGARPGAGRPRKGSLESTKPVPPDIKQAARSAKVTPLEYMLAVMNDETAEAARRDRMAMAAAPYVHRRAADEPIGKKERQLAEAEAAGVNSEWGDDLKPPAGPLN